MTVRKIQRAEIKELIEKDIPFNSMPQGISETSSLGKCWDGDSISIGVTLDNSKVYGGLYEFENGEMLEEWYTYNIFVGNEYISLNGNSVGSLDNKIPDSVLVAIENTISEFLI